MKKEEKDVTRSEMDGGASSADLLLQEIDTLKSENSLLCTDNSRLKEALGKQYPGKHSDVVIL